MVQWLRLHTPKAGGSGSIPSQGTRSHMLQLRPSITKKKKGQPGDNLLLVIFKAASSHYSIFLFQIISWNPTTPQSRIPYGIKMGKSSSSNPIHCHRDKTSHLCNCCQLCSLQDLKCLHFCLCWLNSWCYSRAAQTVAFSGKIPLKFPERKIFLCCAVLAFSV